MDIGQDTGHGQDSPNVVCIIVEPIILMSILLELLICVTDTLNRLPSWPNNSLSVRSKNVWLLASALADPSISPQSSPSQSSRSHTK